MNQSRENTQPAHPIQVAARRSGLSADVIRAWERRYHAVEPVRSGTNRRLYSDEDIERLFLLGQVTRAGRRIGDVAALPLEELRVMVEEDRQAADRISPTAQAKQRSQPANEHLKACLGAIERLDGEALDATLSSASIDLTLPVLMEQLIMPLMTEVGERWHDGRLRVAQEHLATSLVRSFLGGLRSRGASTEGAPEIVVATPARATHEIGALMVSVLAASDGWRVTYLGPDLPAEEITAAVREKGARAVALSIVYPMDDPTLIGELRRLREQLDSNVSMLVGGASAGAYREVLDEIGALVTDDIASLRAELQRLRAESVPS